jgi:hypothetical protein
MKTEETVFEKNLACEDLKSWFIEDFGDCKMGKIVFSKKVTTYTYPDIPPSILHESAISVGITFKTNIFLNRTQYLNVHYIDFEKKYVSGYIHEDNIESVLTGECYHSLYGKEE